MTTHKLDHHLVAKSDDPVYHLHDYDVDLQSNHIYLFGVQDYAIGHDEAINEPGIEYVIANRFIRNLNLCMRVNPRTAVLVHMKTNGGDWTEGMAIYDAIKSCPAPVTILSYTHARSMSSIILQAANKRVLMPNSYFMFHDGDLAVAGTCKTVFSEVEFTKLSDTTMMDIYVSAMKANGKFCKRSKKFIRQWLRSQMDRKENVYLPAKQAVEMGFADQVFDYNWAKLTQYTDEELARG